MQPKYILQEKYTRKSDNKKILAIYYISDFRTTYTDGSVVVVDTKGDPDSMAIIKRKIFEKLYPDIDFHWIAYSKQDSENGWIEYDILKKLRSARKKAKDKLKVK